MSDRYSTATDETLVAKSAAGDLDAFSTLVDRLGPGIRSTVKGMLGPCPEVDEVTQDVFMRFYGALKKFRGDARPGTYLTRIAIRLSINALNKRTKRQKGLAALRANDAFHGGPIRFDEQYALKELILKALQQLSPEFRSVLVLRLIDGYSVQETADILHIPQGTVASRLSRAQMKMQKLLIAYQKS